MIEGNCIHLLNRNLREIHVPNTGTYKYIMLSVYFRFTLYFLDRLDPH